MTGTSTYTATATQTLTYAKQLASKVAADLRGIRAQCNINSPTEVEIQEYEEEAYKLLNAGYLYKVKYGFQRNEVWIKPTLEYTAQELINGNTDDRPGGIYDDYDVEGAIFHSFLEYNSKWHNLTPEEKEKFKKTLPFPRVSGSDAGVDGYFESDRTYSRGGLTLGRRNLRSY